MKNFIITLPEKKNDPKGILKNFLAKTIIKKYPWLSVSGIDEPFGLPGIQYAGPGDALTFGASKKHDVSWIANPYTWMVDDSKKFDLYNDFFTTMNLLEDFAKKSKENKDIIDGKLFGEPYRVYDSFVQIGDRIIPKTPSYFSNINEDEKTSLMMIIIKIKNFFA